VNEPDSQDAVATVPQGPPQTPSPADAREPTAEALPVAPAPPPEQVSTWQETAPPSPQAAVELKPEEVVAYAKAEDLPHVEGYEVLDVLGRGGMGVVYRARDIALGRIVALKMLRSGALADPQEIQRFYREAQAAAHLNHPHLVPVYEVGKHGDLHYFSMAYVGGGTLADHMDRFRDPKSAVALMEMVARAVHYAHCHHVLHRDLKPGNILLGEAGEPLVSDFGLAKLLDSALELTRPGDMVGTPLYMAPEQATGRADQATPASDIWALGVILYELLTGKRPFGGKSREELLRDIQTTDPPRPRSVQSRLPTDLETICLKCLEKDPARRYATAEALADDLARWQSGEPILAKPAPWPRRAWRKVRRHPFVCTAVGVLVLALAGALGALHYTDPDRDLKAMQNVLSRGAPVKLIEEKGPPRWLRWERGEAGTGIDPRGGCFYIQTVIYTLLELMPDPQVARFRFRAEVRHVSDPSHMGEVGIYFAHEKLVGREGPANSFLTLSFTDGSNSLNTVKDAKGQVFCRANLEYRYYREAKIDRNYHALITRPGKAAVNFYAPSAPNELTKPWRSLAVEVSPDEVCVSWENQPFAVMSRADLEGCANELLRNGDETKNLTFQFDPRGSLGLYIVSGAAYFRNVVIEPLPEQQE
jgi:serine/threonine-protein kinase